jgi:molybdopterin/thiamine biosynthesis adenylyltransferase
MNVDEDVFDRQKRVGGWKQDAVSNSRVLIVGAGALGNEVLKLLLQMGVNKITIVDHDNVVTANLNRCVFFSQKDADEKALKAEVLAREGKRLNASAEIATVTKMVELVDESFFKNFDFAFGCLDNLAARMHLNAQCYNIVPLIDGGTSAFRGSVQVVKAPSACLECSYAERDYKLLWKKYSCVGEVLDFIDPKMPALATTTSIVAAMQANEFLKLLFETGDSLVGRKLFYDGLRNSFTTSEISKRKTCPAH